jgi:hypothetical protein
MNTIARAAGLGLAEQIDRALERAEDVGAALALELAHAPERVVARARVERHQLAEHRVALVVEADHLEAIVLAELREHVR